MVTATRKAPPFVADLLVPTEFSTAEDKARFGNQLAAFVLSGFKQEKWTKALYKRLSLTFGHIAHYNMNGFWDEWFSTAAQQADWIRHVLEHPCYGDPAYTHSDLERQFKAWLALHKDEVEEVIRRNAGSEDAEADTEAARVKALHGQTHQRFKVAMMAPPKPGGFGHSRFLMVAVDGSVWVVDHIQCNGTWHVGQEFDVQLSPRCLPTWAGMSVECPRRLKDDHDLAEKHWG